MGYLILVLRVAIGATLLVAGVLKAHDGPALTAATIAGYRLLPSFVIAPLGVALPYAEILLGAYLAGGLFTRISAWLGCAQFAIFAVAVASLVIRNIPADCGCFGAGVRTSPSWGHVGIDLVLAALCALIALRAPGAVALDRIFGFGASGPLEAQHEA